MSGDKDKPELNTLFQIFKDSNVIIIVWFLAVYFVVYLLLKIFRGKDSATNSISKWVDVISLLCVLIYLVVTYFGKTNDEKMQIVSNAYSDFKSYIDNYLSIISSAFFILTLYIVIYIIGLPMDAEGKPVTISIVENLAWLIFVIALFSNFLHYVLGISIASIMDETTDFLHKKAAETDGNTHTGNVAIPNLVTVPVTNEVFNVGNNMFTYDDAQSVCASFGARLATYDEVEDAYNKGGEWCNYGWSEGQAAYFPTQKETWQKLQKSESTKHSCGRPGVNGGYIEDANARFGVNCYGKKPKPSTRELAAIASGPNIPKTPEDILLEKKIEFWNANREKLLNINSYNNNKWSMY